MVRKIGPIGTKIQTNTRQTKKVGQAIQRVPLFKNVYTECQEARGAFSNAHKIARSNGKNQVVSLIKGVGGFAKKVGPIPFTTAAAGFCFLPIGGTTTGLITGLIAKKGITWVGKALKILK